MTSRALNTFLRPPMLLTFAFNLYLLTRQQQEWSVAYRQLSYREQAIQLDSFVSSDENRSYVRRGYIANLTAHNGSVSLSMTSETVTEHRTSQTELDAAKAFWKQKYAYAKSRLVQAEVRSQFLTTRKTRSNQSEKFFHVQLLPTGPSVAPFSCSHFDVHYCRGDATQRKEFSPELQSIVGDFTPVLTTNKKILVMGDSVGIQLSHLIQNQAGIVQRQVLKNYTDTGGVKEWISVAQTQGGGIVAGFRILGFLTKEGPTLPLPPSASGGAGGGGWLYQDVDLVKRYMLRALGSDGTFDTLIFRIPQVWIHLYQVNFDNLRQTVETARNLFNVSTVIFTDLPVINNYVEEASHLLQAALANQRLRQFVNHWQQHVSAFDTRQAKVYLLEIGTLINNLGIRNAQNLGYDVSSPHFLLSRIPENRPFPRSVALNCADHVDSHRQTCPNNMLFKDGIHWCMETVGPRILAGLSCLQQCSTHKCDTFCNSRYMRLRSIG